MSAWRTAAPILLVMVTLIANFSGHAQIPSYRGLYVVINPRIRPGGSNIYDMQVASLRNAGIDGAAVVDTWQDIEPAAPVPGQSAGQLYAWANLDGWLRMIVADHKKISLGIIAGSWSPAWLYRPPANVARVKVTLDNNNGRGCVSRTVPVPWDAGFIERYDRMITDLSLHLKDIGVYGSVAIVKITGINLETPELRLGSTRASDLHCPLEAGVQYLTDAWVQAGFRPQKVEDAWKQIAANTARAFPEKILATDIINSPQAFPPIDANGDITTPPPGPKDEVTGRIIAAGLTPGLLPEKFSTRFVVQWDALDNNLALMRAQKQLLDSGAPIAWQTNGALVANIAGCLAARTRAWSRCSPSDYRDTLANGFNLGGNYIEVWPPNVVSPDFSTVFGDIRRLIRPQ